MTTPYSPAQDGSPRRPCFTRIVFWISFLGLLGLFLGLLADFDLAFTDAGRRVAQKKNAMRSEVARNDVKFIDSLNSVGEPSPGASESALGKSKQMLAVMDDNALASPVAAVMAEMAHEFLDLNEVVLKARAERPALKTSDPDYQAKAVEADETVVLAAQTNIAFWMNVEGRVADNIKAKKVRGLEKSLLLDAYLKGLLQLRPVMIDFYSAVINYYTADSALVNFLRAHLGQFNRLPTGNLVFIEAAVQEQYDTAVQAVQQAATALDGASLKVREKQAEAMQQRSQPAQP